MQENKKTLKQIFLYDSGYYISTFAFGILCSVFASVIIDVPLKFIRVINIDMACFIVGLLAMGCFLVWRSSVIAYNASIYSYKFSLKRAVAHIAVIFLLQIVLTVLLGHAVYIEGPTFRLANFVLSRVAPYADYTSPVYAKYHWLFMLAADIFIYAPLMVYGEYRGAKAHLKDSNIDEDEK